MHVKGDNPNTRNMTTKKLGVPLCKAYCRPTHHCHVLAITFDLSHIFYPKTRQFVQLVSLFRGMQDFPMVTGTTPFFIH